MAAGVPDHSGIQSTQTFCLAAHMTKIRVFLTAFGLAAEADPQSPTGLVLHGCPFADPADPDPVAFAIRRGTVERVVDRTGAGHEGVDAPPTGHHPGPPESAGLSVIPSGEPAEDVSQQRADDGEGAAHTSGRTGGVDDQRGGVTARRDDARGNRFHRPRLPAADGPWHCFEVLDGILTECLVINVRRRFTRRRSS